MGATNSVKTSLIFEIILKNLKSLSDMNRSVKQVNKAIGNQGKVMNKALQPIIKSAVSMEGLRKQHDSFSGAMGMSQQNFRDFNTQGGKFNSVGARMANRIRLMTHGMRGFRMEMLGVMFFGMMLQKAFLGLLRPAMEVYGVFELWRTMLMILFLPILDRLMPYFLRFIDWFIELDPRVQEAIGGFVIFGVILGTLLYLLGTFALGIGSVILALGPLGMGFIKAGVGAKWISGVIGRLGSTFGWFGLAVSAVVAIVIAILINMWLAWRENFANMQDWVTVVKYGIENMVKGMMMMLRGDFKGFLLFIRGWGKMLFGLVMMIGIGVFRMFVVFFKMWLESWKKYLNLIKNVVFGWAGSIISKMRSVISWVSKALRKLARYKKEKKSKAEKGSGDSGGKYDDFIWRAGQAPISINPNDTVVGFKDKAPNIGGASVTYSPVYNINISDKAEFERLINDNNRRVVDDLRRMVKLPA